MTLHLIRALFVLLMGSIGWAYLDRQPGPFGPENVLATFAVAIAFAILILALDIFSSRRKLLALSAVLFGTIVGMALAYVLGFAVVWVVDQFVLPTVDPASGVRDELIGYFKMLLNIACCYLMISFILQTKDDIRFIIPYVMFARHTRGQRPLLLDTNVLIDGRIADVSEVGLIDSRLVVPRFVLEELQLLADSSDKLKRNRGRHGWTFSPSCRPIGRSTW